jgi:integrase
MWKLTSRLFSSSPTFSQLSDEWLADAEKRLRPSWLAESRRLLKRDLAPLSTLRIDKISRRDIAHLLESIAAPGTANHSLALSRAIFNWGIATGRAESNPAQGLKKRYLAARERVLSVGELQRVWEATIDLGDYGRIVRLLILTGQRRDEIGHLQWSEIEQRAGGSVIALPGARTKNHRPHVVSLSELALSQLPLRREGHPHLFGSKPGCGYGGWSKGKAELDAQLDGVTPWTLHDLRRTFVTHMAEREIAPPHIIEAIVNHISGHKAGVAGTYNRALYAQAKREALEAWSAELERICCLWQQGAPAAPRPPL